MTAYEILPAAMCRLRGAVSRVPLARQALAIVGAFLCSYLLYGRMAGAHPAFGWNLIEGIASSFALFVLLRLIDDLDDLERDHPVAHCGGAQRAAIRQRLLAGVAVCIALIAALNITKGSALIAASAAAALAFAAPFGFKRLFPRSLALGSIVFEGAPLLIFAYCYFFWRDSSGAKLPLAAVACVTGLFWTGYEFWKFSRKVHSDAMQPYFLSPRGIRAALNAFLVLALAASVALASFARLSPPYALYAAGMPLVWLAWLNGTWPSALDVQSSSARPAWAGTAFISALELGLLVELLPALGGP